MINSRVTHYHIARSNVLGGWSTTQSDSGHYEACAGCNFNREEMENVGKIIGFKAIVVVEDTVRKF